MAGLQIKYKELFSLSIEQKFYLNKLFRSTDGEPSLDLVLVPTNECRELMERMDIVYRNIPSNAGAIVLARVSGMTGNNDELRFATMPADKLCFLIVSQNPDLINFNDLPVTRDPNRILYFSNQQIDIAAPRNNLHITSAAAGVNAANDSIKKAGAYYRYSSPTPVAPGAAIVKHKLSGIKLEPKGLINESGKADLQFNLTSLPDGKCSLLIDNIIKEEFYLLKDDLSFPVFGVIEVLLDFSLDSNYRVVEAGQSLTPERPFYKIVFPNRSTSWRVTLHLLASGFLYKKIAAMDPPTKAAYLSRLKVLDKDNNVNFSQVSVSDSDIVFVSNAALPLREKYFSLADPKKPLILTLTENTGQGGNEHILASSLPYPSTGSIDARSLPSIYSDIFITI